MRPRFLLPLDALNFSGPIVPNRIEWQKAAEFEHSQVRLR